MGNKQNKDIISENDSSNIYYNKDDNKDDNYNDTVLKYNDREFIYSLKPYIATKDNILDKLHDNGIAVVKDVLNDKEIEEMNNGMWDNLEFLTKNFEIPINRNNKNTWINYEKLLPVKSMLLQYWKIGHAQYVWNLRQNEKIVEIFSKIYECLNSELITSFDGVAYHLPNNNPITINGYYNDDDWLHLDQSYSKPNFCCVQGFVTGKNILPGDATLTFLEKSNRYHKKIAETLNINRESDWNVMEERHLEFYTNNGCKRKNIICPAGSMILWDSRTVHAGQQPLITRKKSNIRNIAYICMMPKLYTTEDIIEKRISAFKEMRMTTHWATQCVLFPKTPRVYDEKILPNVPEMPKPKLNNLGLNLVGINI